MSMTRQQQIAELDAQIEEHLKKIADVVEAGDKRLIEQVFKARITPLLGLWEAKVIITRLPEN